MERRLRFFRLFLILLCSTGFTIRSSSHVQPDSVVVLRSDESQSAEQLLDQVETESDNSQLLDRLEWIQEHPFGLNTVSREELATIPFLTPAEVSAIVKLRKRLKGFRSLEQLRILESDGDAILLKIRPYLIVEDSDQANQPHSIIRFSSRVVKDLQPRSGFQDSSFLGSPLKGYSRLTFDRGERMQAGVLFEKDAGEKFGDGFASGYLALKDLLFMSHAIVGDYVIEAGQGLVFWRSSAFGKGSETVSIVKKSGLGAQPYRSTDEFNFLRGGVFTSSMDLGGHKLSLTALYSHRRLSAMGDEGAITSFYEEGLFRTENESRKMSNVAERLLGGRTQFTAEGDWSIGGSFYHSSFSKPIVTERVFEFSGSTATVAGIDAEVHFGWLAPKVSQVTLFGEMARSGDGAGAGIAGVVLNLVRNASLAMTYRDYSPRFSPLHAAGFGERSLPKNERGFYIGAEAWLMTWLHVAGYLDHFSFPWRTFDTPLPTSGRDMLVQINAKFPRGFELSLRYTNKKGESNQASLDTFSRETRLLVDRVQQKIRLAALYHANKGIRLTGRIERTFVNFSLLNRREQGTLIYQNLQLGLASSFTAEARLIFFDTGSYDSRLYEYETDLRGVFSNPALSGKGRRWYFLVRWKIGNALNVSAKYSETQYDDRVTIGSGLTEIRGDVDNRISVQLDFLY